ncbi:4208_t:CDS:1, partial [Racocetra persica]
NSQNLLSQSLPFQSLPSLSLSNKSNHTPPYILENENDDNVSEMSELVFSNPESEAEELRKQEELYALSSRHVKNASSDEINQLIILQSHWNSFDLTIQNIILTQFDTAMKLFEKMNE